MISLATPSSIAALYAITKQIVHTTLQTWSLRSTLMATWHMVSSQQHPVICHDPVNRLWFSLHIFHHIQILDFQWHILPFELLLSLQRVQPLLRLEQTCKTEGALPSLHIWKHFPSVSFQNQPRFEKLCSSNWESFPHEIFGWSIQITSPKKTIETTIAMVVGGRNPAFTS